MTAKMHIRKYKYSNWIGRAAIVLFSGVFLGACAGLPGVAKTPEDTVRERAQSRWNALVAGNWEKAYSLTAPSYRAVADVNRFRARIGNAAGWTGAEVVSVSCAAESCTARIRLDFRPVLGMRQGEQGSTHFDEKWVQEDGGWWLFQQL